MKRVYRSMLSTLLASVVDVAMLRKRAEKFSTTPHLEIVSSEARFLAGFKERHEDDIYAKLNDEKAFNLQDR